MPAATPGQDFTNESGTITFAHGAPGGRELAIPTILDSLAEGQEQVTVTVSEAGFSGPSDPARSRAFGLISDNSLRPTTTIGLADAQATEGGALAFTATLSQALDRDVQFTFSVRDGTAVAPGDYAGGPGNGTIPAGATTTTVNISTVQDSEAEANETLTVRLGNITNATAGDVEAVGTIGDDGGPSPGGPPPPPPPPPPAEPPLPSRRPPRPRHPPRPAPSRTGTRWPPRSPRTSSPPASGSLDRGSAAWPPLGPNRRGHRFPLVGRGVRAGQPSARLRLRR